MNVKEFILQVIFCIGVSYLLVIFVVSFSTYEEESVNGSQMNINVKHVIFESGKKKCIYRHILHKR
jgi:hypothetical protein